MNRVSQGLRGLLLAVAFLMVATPASAGILFQDSFEGGRKASAMNGISWGYVSGDVTVSNARASKGSYALAFPFEGVRRGEDSFQEQRINFGKAYTELWIKYDLFIPSNYAHRSDGASNNKFFAIFNNNYRPGFQVNFSLSPISGGGSEIEVHYYRNGSEQEVEGGTPIISAGDLGKWHRIVMHFKVPSGSNTADGIMELWKNGQQIYSSKKLASNGTSGLNFMDEAYILGWANSGFDQLTTLYVDDVIIADTPIQLTETGNAPAPAPMAPVLNSVQ